MPSVRRMITEAEPQDRDEFWDALSKAMSWRGCDKHCTCHACDFVRKVEEIGLRNGVTFEEFT